MLHGAERGSWPIRQRCSHSATVSHTWIMYNFWSFPVHPICMLYFEQVPPTCVRQWCSTAHIIRNHDATQPCLSQHCHLWHPTFTHARTPSFLSRYHLLTRNQLPFLKLHFFSTCNIDDPYGPTRFSVLFSSILQAYTESSGISLAKHLLTLQLQNYHSVEAITALLQDQTRTSRNFGENDRPKGLAKKATSILSTLSVSAPLDWAIDLAS